MSAVGWRLTLEPCADLVAWSLLRREPASAGVQVWAGLIEDGSRARELTMLLTSGPDPGLADPVQEALGARELGFALLPQVLRRGLEDASSLQTLTICSRGWLARVPWDALAVNQDGRRVVETSVLLGGLAAGLLEGRVAPDRPEGVGSLWVVDPGPPEGAWRPLFPSGYPDELAAAIRPGDSLVPSGLPFDAADLSRALTEQPWARFIYLGHIGARSESPAATGLVLTGPGGPALLTAHEWLRDPSRWPAPAKVALLGCGSDDAGHQEHSGLITAALNAGAGLVTGTRWSMANREGVLRLVAGVSDAFEARSPLHALRAWQLGELDRWRQTGDPAASPAFWSALVSYDRGLLVEGGLQ